MSQQEEISIEVTDAMILARVHSARLDEEHSFRLEGEIGAITRKVARRPLILDLTEVEEMPGESLGALVDLLQQCRQDQRKLILVGLRPPVLEIMSVTQLGRLFEYRDNLDDALANLEPSD